MELPLSSSRRRPDPRPATPRAGLHGRRQALRLCKPLAAGDAHGAELVKTRERMLHVRDPIARGREALPAGLIPGPPAPGRAAHVGDTPAVCGVYRPVRVPLGRPDIGGGTPPGPASCGPVPPARTDPPGGVASRTSLLPSCAGTPRIRCDEGRKPAGRGGLGQGGREPIRPGSRGVLLATVVASVNCPRCLAEHVTKHPPARNHPRAIAVMIPCIGSACCGRLAHRQALSTGGFPDVRSCRCEDGRQSIWPLDAAYRPAALGQPVASVGER